MRQRCGHVGRQRGRQICPGGRYQPQAQVCQQHRRHEDETDCGQQDEKSGGKYVYGGRLGEDHTAHRERQPNSGQRQDVRGATGALECGSTSMAVRK